MTQRILSISGLRGVVGDGLDPEYVVRFAAALGTMAEGRPVVLSRDGRTTGMMFKEAAIAGLTAVGCRVLDADVATTPTCGVLVTELGAAAGLQITASHNPVQWNGLKPFTSAGSVFDAETGETIRRSAAVRRLGLPVPGTASAASRRFPIRPGRTSSGFVKLIDAEAIRKPCTEGRAGLQSRLRSGGDPFVPATTGV